MKNIKLPHISDITPHRDHYIPHSFETGLLFQSYTSYIIYI